MSIQSPSKARKSLTKLALAVTGLALVFALQAPRPAFALTCEEECTRYHNGCLNSCYRICSEAECYDTCWGQCDADNFYCLNQC
jgi:hypothetical protein